MARMKVQMASDRTPHQAATCWHREALHGYGEHRRITVNLLIALFPRVDVQNGKNKCLGRVATHNQKLHYLWILAAPRHHHSAVSAACGQDADHRHNVKSLVRTAWDSWPVQGCWKVMEDVVRLSVDLWDCLIRGGTFGFLLVGVTDLTNWLSSRTWL
jgi:hypothetical protein